MNEKILMFGLDDKQTGFVKKISSNLKIKAVAVNKDMYGCTLAMLAEGKGIPENNIRETSYGPLLVFCRLSDKHMDRILAQLKNENTGIEYKAVMTPTNSKWSVRKLYFELERERRTLG